MQLTPLKPLDPLTPLGSLDAISGIANAISNYLSVAERESTRRAQIAADAEIELARIRTMRELILHATDRVFDERRRSFAMCERTLEHALATNNTELAVQALTCCINTVSISPFQGLAGFVTHQQAAQPLMIDV